MVVLMWYPTLKKEQKLPVFEKTLKNWH